MSKRSSRPRTRIIHSDENFEVVHHRNAGRQLPEKVTIRFLTDRPLHVASFIKNRQTSSGPNDTLDITVDELFDLAEVLDDLCDAIEDAHDLHHNPSTSGEQYV